KGIFRPVPDTSPSDSASVTQFRQQLFGFRDGMTYLAPAPLYHSAPQAALAAALRAGSTAVVMEHFQPEEWLALVERHHVTHCKMVPTMFHRLLALPDE